MKMYLVGGAVRDELLGVASKDQDFTVVLDGYDLDAIDEFGPFGAMIHNLERMGFKIFLETPEYLTVRAQFPQEWNGSLSTGDNGNAEFVYTDFAARRLTADFVLARKEKDYTDGRRPDVVEPGTLMDDLARRDFTMNAIAKGSDGSYIDPFNGQKDIEQKIIRAVGDPFERLTEDALRAVRALRFSVTKGFSIHPDLRFAMQSAAVVDSLATKISDERIKDELSKMFRFDTKASIIALYQYPALLGVMFSGSVSLDATMKTKGRGTAGNRKEGPGRPLPIAYNGCKCSCHFQRGVRHMAACCRPTKG